MPGIGMNSPYDSIDTTKQHPLGYSVRYFNTTLRYAYNAGADTLAAGEIIGGSQTSAQYGYISGTAADILDSTSSTSIGLGMALAAVPTGKYCWVQTSGPSLAAITSDGNIAAGSNIGMGGTTSPDGTILPIADGTEENAGLGYATAADSGTTCAVGTIILGCDHRW